MREQTTGPIWLDPNNPYAPFPPAQHALRDPNGLLAMGGDLSPTRLLRAYRQGVFPWYSTGQPILWWSPDPRSVIVPAQIKISRSLGKTLRQARFEISCDRAFDAVIQACAEPRDAEGSTWITPEMSRAYRSLHRQGYAHSVEAWQDGRLVGGLYGVALGKVFFGESMFSRVRDASKAAFASQCRWLHAWGYELVDCQVHSAHLESLGAVTVARAQFLEQLEQYCDQAPAAAWRSLPTPP